MVGAHRDGASPSVGSLPRQAEGSGSRESSSSSLVAIAGDRLASRTVYGCVCTAVHRVRPYTIGVSVRDDLETVAAYQRNLPSVRGEAIDAARAEGVTWREIAALLGMTENGAHKAHAAWKVRVSGI